MKKQFKVWCMKHKKKGYLAWANLYRTREDCLLSETRIDSGYSPVRVVVTELKKDSK